MMTESIRVAGKTKEQLDWLKSHGYESITNAASVAVDRLYQSERSTMNTEYTFSEKDVLDANFAKNCIEAATAEGSTPEAEAVYGIDPEGNKDFINENLEQLKRGLAILDQARLIIARTRQIRGTAIPNPLVSPDAPTLLIDSGHIATSEAQRQITLVKRAQYQFWDHTGSGETYAVRLVSGQITGIVGPLAYDQLDPDNISDYEYDDNPEDSEWAQTQEWRLHETQD